MVERNGTQPADVASWDLDLLQGVTGADAMSMGLAAAAELVDDGAALGVVDWADRVLGEDPSDVVEPLGDRGRHRDGALLIRLDAEQRLDEREVSAEVEQGHHRQSRAGERVVGVVPFGTLCVEPDPAVGHQVGEFGECRHQELLEHRNVQQAAVGAREQSTVSAHALLALGDRCGMVGVVGDRVARVAHDLVVIGQEVRNVGVGEDIAVQPAGAGTGFVALPHLQQPQQVDDLVISPVPDVAPRVGGIGHLPVDAACGDPVGVVALDRGGIEELRDDVDEVGGRRLEERFPVLEDVAPVALVRQQRIAPIVAYVDREPVPGAARVAVASREAERQVLEHEPHEIGVPDVEGVGAQRQFVDPRVESVEPVAVTFGDLGVAVADEVSEVAARYGLTEREHAATHAVEQHVREVMGIGHRVAGALESVGIGEQCSQALRPELDVVGDLDGGVAVACRRDHRSQRRVVEPGVRDHRPRRRFRHVHGAAQQVRAGPSRDRRRGSCRSAGEHVVDGGRVEQEVG